jgi:lipoprotein-anchoring transpeptidase ErfK/SrfK
MDGSAVQKVDFLKAADSEAPGEGYYEFAAASDASQVMDIEAGSVSPGANVRMIGANGTDAQKFAVRMNGDGTCTIMSVSSGMFVTADGTASGSNVRQAVKNGGTSSRWIVKAVGDGTYYICAASGGAVLTISNGNIQLGDPTGAINQKFALKKTDYSLPTGTYCLASAINLGYVIDVEGGSKKNQANIQLYTNNGTTAQKYEIVDKGYGYVAIRNAGSGLVLDVAGGSRQNGGNIWQYQDNGSDAQLFAVHKNSGGTYTFVNAGSGKVIDVAAGRAANCTNIQQYDYNGSAAQRFVLRNAAESIPGEGYYEFTSSSDASQVMDVEAGSISQGANVRMYGVNGTGAQKFAVKMNGDGTCAIISVNSGMYVTADGTASGSNVRQALKSESTSSRWILESAGDGTYCVRLATGGMALTISNGNIQLGSSSGSSSQKFVLKKTNYSLPTGKYFFASAANTGYVMDVFEGSRKMQANVRLWAKNGTNAQKFEIVDKGYGYVAIRNVQSKHMLDVAGGSRQNGANIWQYRDNGSDAQLFAVHSNGDGTYTFVNAASGKVIDVAGGRAANGTNIQQYDSNGTAAQKFVLQATSGSDNNPIDYSIYQPPKPAPLIVDSIDQKAQGYSSATKYEILVNRSNHTVSIYQGSRGNWTRIKRFACGDGKASTPTIEGVFSVGIKMKSFGHGYTCWYATQISGNYLFHSVLYYPGSMSRIQDGRLGMGVSHGCVRLAIENAKWIYDNIPASTRIVIYH